MLEATLFTKYQKLDTLTTKAVDRLRPCYEIAKLFVVELNKTAGQPYVTKTGKKGKSKTYTETMVLKDLKKLKLTKKNQENKEVVDEHKATGFLTECEKSSIGFRFYYQCKVKK